MQEPGAKEHVIALAVYGRRDVSHTGRLACARQKRLLDNWLRDKMNHKGYWCWVVLVDKW